MAVKKKECTMLTMGTVVELKDKGIDMPTIVTVQYQVNMQTYFVKESLKLKTSLIKIGPIPIGMRKVPKIDTTIGSEVKVNYNPQNPSMAYITDNKGIINC